MLKGDRIVPFLRRSELPALSTLDKKTLASFKSIDDAVFVAYMDQKDPGFKSIFTDLASHNHERFAFGIVTDAALAKTERVPLGCIVRYKAGEDEQNLCGQSRLDVLQDFVEKSTAPLIGEMTRRNELKYLQVRCPVYVEYDGADKIAQAGKSLVYIFAETENERLGYKTEFIQLAKKYQEYLNFVIIDAIEYAYMAPALGLKAGSFPALAVHNPMMGQVFPFDQTRHITPVAAESFVLDIVQGRTQPYSSPTGEGIVHEEL
jgi:protein disulfide-isomerase A1